jgi:hypothetical protein
METALSKTDYIFLLISLSVIPSSGTYCSLFLLPAHLNESIGKSEISIRPIMVQNNMKTLRFQIPRMSTMKYLL